MIWDEPLQTLCRECTLFFKSLVITLMTDLCTLKGTEPEDDREKQAQFAWMIRLLTSPKWLDQRTALFAIEDLRPGLIEVCLLNPCIWSQKLARVLLDNGDKMFRRDWTDIYNVFVMTSERDNAQVIEPGGQVAGMNDMSSPTGIEPTQYLKAGGWKLWDGPWTPRPIGI
jgi:hypothetical protein